MSKRHRVVPIGPVITTPPGAIPPIIISGQQPLQFPLQPFQYPTYYEIPSSYWEVPISPYNHLPPVLESRFIPAIPPLFPPVYGPIPPLFPPVLPPLYPYPIPPYAFPIIF